jgi:hypothetical protein
MAAAQRCSPAMTAARPSTVRPSSRCAARWPAPARARLLERGPRRPGAPSRPGAGVLRYGTGPAYSIGRPNCRCSRGPGNGMVATAVPADGLLGYVQGVSDRPGHASAGETHDFGSARSCWLGARSPRSARERSKSASAHDRAYPRREEIHISRRTAPGIGTAGRSGAAAPRGSGLRRSCGSASRRRPGLGAAGVRSAELTSSPSPVRLAPRTPLCNPTSNPWFRSRPSR